MTMSSKAWGDPLHPPIEQLPTGPDRLAAIQAARDAQLRNAQIEADRILESQLPKLLEDERQERQQKQADAHLQAVVAEVTAGFTELRPECKGIYQEYEQVLKAAGQFVNSSRATSEKLRALARKLRTAVDAAGKGNHFAEHLAECGGTDLALRLMPPDHTLRQGTLERVLVEAARPSGDIIYDPKLKFNKVLRY